MTTASELRAMDPELLQARLAEVKAEMFNLRFQYATGQFDRPHRFRELKKEVARILTVLSEQATATVEAEEADAATQEDSPKLSFRQRRAMRRKARKETVVAAESAAAGAAGEGVDITPAPVAHDHDHDHDHDHEDEVDDEAAVDEVDDESAVDEVDDEVKAEAEADAEAEEAEAEAAAEAAVEQAEADEADGADDDDDAAEEKA